MKISQSLLKSLLDYRNGRECGLIFKAKYIDGRYDLFPPSEAQNVGAWFEYQVTGSIPKNGDVPKAEYMKRGKDEAGNPQLTAEYRLMSEHIKNFHNIMETYGFEIIRAGEDIKALIPDSLEKYGEEVWLTGTVDIRVKATKTIYSMYEYQRVLVAEAGQQAFIDIKTTGLLDDKWNDYGWEIGNLHNKVKLVTQPVQYKMIEKMNTGIEPPFIFLLFSSGSPTDARIIDFRVDETAFEEHRSFVDMGVQNMQHLLRNGFKPRPSLDECSNCPLRENCEYRATTAPITVYYFASQP